MNRSGERMQGMDGKGQKVRPVWISVVGARPQFVKVAPICRAVEAHNAQRSNGHIEHQILHTGQHYDREVAELLFEQLGLPQPRYNLGVGSGTHGTQLARMLARIEPVFKSHRPDWVIVYGDTNSTLAGALLAARLDLPLAHVEAGCRSRDMSQPEEQNRIVTDHLSRLLLAPSQHAVDNLHREGIGTAADTLRRVVNVGDVLMDALMQNAELAESRAQSSLEGFGLEPRGYYLLTLHRAENTDNMERFSEILKAVGELELPVLFPVHPRTQHILYVEKIALAKNVRTVPAVGYFDMLMLQKNARKVLTDSGGVQKEAFYLGVPCVTLREKTEWPETVERGANRIAGATMESIREAVAFERRADVAFGGANPYGTGRAAAEIVKELLAEQGKKCMGNGTTPGTETGAAAAPRSYSQAAGLGPA
jgi:UDP-N-acetylglucosamine 2-epimerase